MIANRSAPTDTILPHVVYQDLRAAIAWLIKVFGFTERYRYGDPIEGAQLSLGKAFIMVTTARFGRSSPTQIGSITGFLTVFMEDVDAHYARSKAAGANIVEEPHETIYGEFQYAVVDCEGHRWLFSRHTRDLSPTDWGATIATPNN